MRQEFRKWMARFAPAVTYAQDVRTHYVPGTTDSSKCHTSACVNEVSGVPAVGGPTDWILARHLKNTINCQMAAKGFTKMNSRNAEIQIAINQERQIKRLRLTPLGRRLRFILGDCFRFLILIALGGLVLCSPARAQAQPAEQPREELRVPKAASASGDVAKAQQQGGIVVGRVIDPMGKGVPGADVVLMRDKSVLDQVQSDDNGRFTFVHVSPGSLQLRIVAEGFSTEEIPGTMVPGENYVFPEVCLSLATQVTEIRVSPPLDEIAQEQFKDEEKQRVFGIVPNFYVSYTDDAAPLTPKRKFQLALKAMTDPVGISAVSTIAAVNQASDRFSGYGQGADGYAKRYGASYANFASGLFIGGAVLPSILKQDPRYFYKGTGTKRSRFLYAVSRVFICKSDNQRWQPNYSSVFGDLAAGGLSNLYIPERDHHGARLTFENASIAMSTTAVLDVLQEFVLRKITSKSE